MNGSMNTHTFRICSSYALAFGAGIVAGGVAIRLYALVLDVAEMKVPCYCRENIEEESGENGQLWSLKDEPMYVLLD